MGWISFICYTVRNGVYIAIAIGSSIGGIAVINKCVEGVMAMLRRSSTPVPPRVREYVLPHSERPASNKSCSKSPYKSGSIPSGGYTVSGTPKRDYCCDGNNVMTKGLNSEQKSAEARRNSAGPSIPDVIRGSSANRPIIPEILKDNLVNKPVMPEASVDDYVQQVPDQLHKIMPKYDADNLDLRCLRDDPCQNEEKEKSPALLNFFEIYNACVKKKRVVNETVNEVKRGKTAR